MLWDYYDGVAGTTSKASAYDLACYRYAGDPDRKQQRDECVLAAYVKGFLEYKKDSQIHGVIFNQMSPNAVSANERTSGRRTFCGSAWICSESGGLCDRKPSSGSGASGRDPELKNRLQSLQRSGKNTGY